MRFQLQTELDQADRKQIQDLIVGEINALTRSVMAEKVNSEIDRLFQSLGDRLVKVDEFTAQQRNRFSLVVRDAIVRAWPGDFGEQVLKEIVVRLTQSHDFLKEVREVSFKISEQVRIVTREFVQNAVDAEVARKLRNKTVWEAESQKEYIRNLIVEVLKENKLV